MKILHTSDWHLGKYLENYYRLEEQEQFLNELLEIVVQENIDLILIAGDIFDTINPPADAEKLFYKSLINLSQNGKIPIIIISGNHDSAKRLSAINPLSFEMGIIILGTIKDIILPGTYSNLKILNSGEGFIEIEINNEKAVILNLGYPSEKRLNELIFFSNEENKNQKSYSDKISEIIKNLSKNFREDTINILMGHFYIIGGSTEDSERDISLGGNYAVSNEALPKNADYIAMGHLHRPQKITKCPIPHGYYSGSPIEYSKSEILHPKCVFIFTINKKENTNSIEKKYLKNYKPIKIWKTKNIEEALLMCKENQEENYYVYLEIETSRVILQSELKEMKSLKNNIVEIIPILKTSNQENSENFIYIEKSIQEEFIDFYTEKYEINPTEEIINLFLEINNEFEEEGI